MVDEGANSRPAAVGHAVSIASDDLGARIVVVRGRRVMLDVDLAAVYGVEPKRLNEQVKRNRARFPDDFMFELTLDETRAIQTSRSQIATLKRGHNIKHAPSAFTEHGAPMRAVLNSAVAIVASIQVVRAFAQLRATAARHEELAGRLMHSTPGSAASFRSCSMRSVS